MNILEEYSPLTLFAMATIPVACTVAVLGAYKDYQANTFPQRTAISAFSSSLMWLTMPLWIPYTICEVSRNIQIRQDGNTTEVVYHRPSVGNNIIPSLNTISPDNNEDAQ